MSDQQTNEKFSRRGVLGLTTSALAAGATFSLPPNAGAAPGGGEKFEPLQEFKYSLDSSKGWEGPAGSAREATVTQLPVSNSIAGVSMRLTPGGLRELHWHSIAAEWAYMIEGRCRITVFSPNGQAEIVDSKKAISGISRRDIRIRCKAWVPRSATSFWLSMTAISPNSERLASPIGGIRCLVKYSRKGLD